MRPSRLNPNLHPKGGFSFTDAEGVKHLADDLERLIEVVTHYRKRAQRPPGDPQTEIEDQLCRRHKALCRVGPVGQAEMPHPPGATIEQVSLAIHVAYNIKQGEHYPGGSVERPEAEQRAAICAACPHAVNWTVGCRPCTKNVEGKTDTILFPRPVVESTRNMACQLSKDSLELAVWRVNGRKVKTAPPACWRPATPAQPPVA